MKKIAFIFGIAFVATLALSSCKKDYVCSCTYTDPTTSQSISLDADILDAKKKDAEQACEDLDATWSLVDANAACELK